MVFLRSIFLEVYFIDVVVYRFWLYKSLYGSVGFVY